jgi:hypothetical protein
VTFLSLFHFGVPFCTHQLSINEYSSAFAHFSNTEECANASTKLNHVNISCENSTPKSSFVLRYKQLKYTFMDKFIKIARTHRAYVQNVTKFSPRAGTRQVLI